MLDAMQGRLGARKEIDYVYIFCYIESIKGGLMVVHGVVGGKGEGLWVVGGEEGGRRRAIDGVYTELRREVAGLAVCVCPYCMYMGVGHGCTVSQGEICKAGLSFSSPLN